MSSVVRVEVASFVHEKHKIEITGRSIRNIFFIVIRLEESKGFDAQISSNSFCRDKMNGPKYKNIFLDSSHRIDLKLDSLFIICYPQFEGYYKSVDEDE